MALSGIRTVRNILIAFVLIGMMTALWRACGTIPFIVYHASGLCHPSLMLLMTFLLCSIVSTLTGTSFGTAATIGVICTTMANSMGIPIILTGGAVLSGAFFGDRCSPMSTSALLVSSVTGTDIFRNIRGMIRTSIIPLILTSAIYLALGYATGGEGSVSGIEKVFSSFFDLNPMTVLPAAVIVVLSLMRCDVKISMAVSTICGAVVAIAIQDLRVDDVIRIAFEGYHPEDIAVSTLLSGGGVLSMVNVFLIVCISSAYSGIFQGTGLLDGVHDAISALAGRITSFGAIIAVSIAGALISCNQTLTIMLANQLCGHLIEDKERMALYLEDTAVVIAPLVPWSIASAVPLAAIGAPHSSILIACYLYLLPIAGYIAALRHSLCGPESR